ncbi:MAG: clan AA aspartic protease [Chloroflexota bacterium]|nr:clan AA aspartic protease [Chloroflexota bacterium]
MITGRVSSDQQALIAIDIMDGEGQPRSQEVVLDTGFTGYLTLPSESIRELGLPSVGQRTFELANGELFDFQVYIGSVSWHGRQSDVLVLQSDSVPLLGMTLLWGSRVCMDALNEGEVTIEELSPAP